MADRHQDRRVTYTKMFLREALLELMKEKPISKITPTELCRKADVNRNTFYAHYQSPEELLEEIEGELMSRLCSSIDGAFRTDSFEALLQDICRLIEENVDLCKVILSENGASDFLASVIRVTHDSTMEKWQAQGSIVPEERLEMLYRYCIGGSVIIIRDWVNGGLKQPAETIAQILSEANSGALLGLKSAQNPS